MKPLVKWAFRCFVKSPSNLSLRTNESEKTNPLSAALGGVVQDAPMAKETI
jgi:hypothetical protein